jgi:hypothetical protein
MVRIFNSVDQMHSVTYDRMKHAEEEAVVACFKLLSKHATEWLQKTSRNLGQNNQVTWDEVEASRLVNWKGYGSGRGLL